MVSKIEKSFFTFLKMLVNVANKLSLESLKDLFVYIPAAALAGVVIVAVAPSFSPTAIKVKIKT